MTAHAIVVGIYLLALIGVGAVKARKIKSQEDFSLAGRGLPTFVLVGTLLATWIGTGSIFGNAGETYRTGAAMFLLPFATLAGIVLLYFLAERIRRFGQFTIQDILEARFGFGARVLGTITLLLAYVIIVSYQYRAGAAVVQELGGDEPIGAVPATVGVAAFVIAYTVLAGMYSVAYTDVANGALMTIGVAIALVVLFSDVGGIDGITESLPAANLDVMGGFSILQLISFGLPAFLLVIGDANIVQRFFSARSPREARISTGWLLIGVLVLELAIIAVALLGSALVAQGKLEAPDNDGHIIVDLAFHSLPTALGAVLIATVVAVVVSTADSFLLSPATSLVRDVYQRIYRPDASPADVVLVGRVVVVALGLIALALAFTSDKFFDVALFAYTIYGAGITPALFAAYFWKRATAAGAVSSMITGVGTSVLWQFGVMEGGLRLADHDTWLAEVDAVIPAILVSVLVLVGVSLATPPPTDEQAASI